MKYSIVFALLAASSLLDHVNALPIVSTNDLQHLSSRSPEPLKFKLKAPKVRAQPMRARRPVVARKSSTKPVARKQPAVHAAPAKTVSKAQTIRAAPAKPKGGGSVVKPAANNSAGQATKPVTNKPGVKAADPIKPVTKPATKAPASKSSEGHSAPESVPAPKMNKSVTNGDKATSKSSAPKADKPVTEKLVKQATPEKPAPKGNDPNAGSMLSDTLSTVASVGASVIPSLGQSQNPNDGGSGLVDDSNVAQTPLAVGKTATGTKKNDDSASKSETPGHAEGQGAATKSKTPTQDHDGVATGADDQENPAEKSSKISSAPGKSNDDGDSTLHDKDTSASVKTEPKLSWRQKASAAASGALAGGVAGLATGALATGAELGTSVINMQNSVMQFQRNKALFDDEQKQRELTNIKTDQQIKDAKAALTPAGATPGSGEAGADDSESEDDSTAPSDTAKTTDESESDVKDNRSTDDTKGGSETSVEEQSASETEGSGTKDATDTSTEGTEDATTASNEKSAESGNSRDNVGRPGDADGSSEGAAATLDTGSANGSVANATADKPLDGASDPDKNAETEKSVATEVVSNKVKSEDGNQEKDENETGKKEQGSAEVNGDKTVGKGSELPGGDAEQGGQEKVQAKNEEEI